MLSLVHVLEWRAAVSPEAVALTDHQGARHLSVLPLFHVAGLANLCYVLFTGGQLHILGGFGPAGFVDELVSRPFWAGRDRQVS